MRLDLRIQQDLSFNRTRPATRLGSRHGAANGGTNSTVVELWVLPKQILPDRFPNGTWCDEEEQAIQSVE
jgi:hypothetical protein